MTNILSILVMAPQQGSSAASGMMQIGFMLLIIVVFYFFMIRPQVKRQKELANFRSSLKKGDKVVTTGGIYGKITDVSETTIELEIASSITIKVDKTAVIRDPSDLNQK